MRLIVSLIALIAAVVLAVQNATPVTLNAFFWRLDASLAVIIVLGFAVGALAATIALMPAWFRSHKQVRRLQSRVAELESMPTPTHTDVALPATGPYPNATLPH